MPDYRIKSHPILTIPSTQSINFFWQDQKLSAQQGETIASALFANGIRIFGHHPNDGSPQGLYCANGQCSQCMVIANNLPVKACVRFIEPDMHIYPAKDRVQLPEVHKAPEMEPIETVQLPVLILGGGPAGLSAAIELGKAGIRALLIDDKNRLGGKLVLQTHRFFGSTEAVYAGTRGIDIATRLSSELRQYASVEVWLNSTALAVFSDHKVGILRAGSRYVLVQPQILLVATGAREKFLAFKGNTLPGVYGAGAFQTLVNRDLVLPAQKLFIVGGGNVGLIAGYHALQAGIQVVGLVEALHECGGYKVHKDKLVRMGVPVYTSHTILSANGSDRVESVTITQLDENFKPVSGSEKSFACDSVLIAVGLDPVNEFFIKASQYGMKVFASGDAEEIAEASAAIFSGKIHGVEIAQELGHTTGTVPAVWRKTIEILKSKPGANYPENHPESTEGIVPVIHCTQEIPCNPCAEICPNGLFFIDPQDIRKVPTFLGNNYCCQYCEQCVAGCPGLAITLVDYHINTGQALVSVPYEFTRQTIIQRDWITVLDTEGSPLGEGAVYHVHAIPGNDRTWIVQVVVPISIAAQVAGVRVQDPQVGSSLPETIEHLADDVMICRCERVTAGEIRALIQKGYHEIKTVTRAGMGACGSKTCALLIERLLLEGGVSDKQITKGTHRPLFVEVPLSVFAGCKE